jgi:type I restriction enzyme, S subunit
MSFPRYPKYKDSGVEWLGEVPEGWEVNRIKHLAQIESGHTPSRSVEEYWVNCTIPWVSLNDSSFLRENDYISDTAFRISELGMANSSAHLLPCPAVVFSRDATVGLCAITTQPMAVSQHFIAYLCGPKLLPEYLLFSLKAMSQHLERLSLGATIATIGMDDVRSLVSAAPPVSEQKAIIDFVKKEVGKVDELVAEQQRLMELLKEKRQAVISHAVTKGLNPRAPMKPSGIEWLGDVPEHWEVKPLKYVVSLTSGGTPNKENLAYWDGEVPWASSKDLKTDELFDTQDHITQKALDDGAAALIPGGSILTVVRGMILLHTFPVVVARVPMAINQDLKAIAPTAGVDADYLAWLLRGAAAEVLSRTDEAGHGTKVLRMEAWLAMPVPVPPLREQMSITATIIGQLGKLDALAAEAQKAIDLLQERRTALISAAVTGQIDVRRLATA